MVFPLWLYANFPTKNAVIFRTLFLASHSGRGNIEGLAKNAFQKVIITLPKHKI